MSQKTITYDHTVDYSGGTPVNIVINDKITLDTFLAEKFELVGSHFDNSSHQIPFIAQDLEYIYVCWYTSVTGSYLSVEKFQKIDMTSVASYTSTYVGAFGIAVYGDYIYVCYYQGGKLVKLNKSDLTYVGSITMASPKACLMDPSGDYLWVMTLYQSYWYLNKVRLSDFSTPWGGLRGHFYDGFDGVWQDDLYIYTSMRVFGTCSVSRYKKDLSVYAEVGFTTDIGRYSMGGFSDGVNCYVAARVGTSTEIYQHAIADWTGLASLKAVYPVVTPYSMVYDGSKYVYLAQGSSPGKVSQILFEDWTRTEVTFAANHNVAWALDLLGSDLVCGCYPPASYGALELISLGGSEYVASGTFEDSINIHIDLGKVTGSNIHFTQTLPEGTTCLIYAKKDLADEWTLINENEPFPDILGISLIADPTTVYWKVELATTNPVVTPELSLVEFTIDGVNIKPSVGFVVDPDQYNQIYWRLNPTGSEIGMPCIEFEANGKIAFQIEAKADKITTATLNMFIPSTMTENLPNTPRIDLYNVTLTETRELVATGAWQDVIYIFEPTMDTIYKLEIVLGSYVPGVFAILDSVIVVET